MEITKAKINYVEPDVIQIEKDFVGYWRVHNGEYFTNGFKTKEEAREFAIKNNGIAIAYCFMHNGIILYKHKENIDDHYST